MSEELLVRNCAPTLARLKTANLFSCPYENRTELLNALRQLNRRLGPKGIRAVPLRFSDRRVLVYLYRPAMLKQDLSGNASAALLRRCGYSSSCPEECLTTLARRLRAQAEFPHEIGLFLGYPPEDVQGFLEKKPCKCVGCWRVYENENQAKKTFALYKKCTSIYCQQLAKGTDIERLTVAG